jgi:hypothetical protein
MAPYAHKFLEPLSACLRSTTDLRVSSVLSLPLIAKHINKENSEKFLSNLFLELANAVHAEADLDAMEVKQGAIFRII